METTTINLSWLCIVVPVGVMVVAAILGTRSKLRYASRIFNAQARGAFADMNTPEAKFRFRRLAVLALIGAVGMIISLVILIIQWLGGILVPFGVTLISVCVFGVVTAIAGFLMRREIDRRL